MICFHKCLALCVCCPFRANPSKWELDVVVDVEMHWEYTSALDTLYFVCVSKSTFFFLRKEIAGCSGGRDQEDCGSKPVQVNIWWDPILKKILHKKCWWSASRFRPWVQASVSKKKEKKRKERK
jgi:hypothetical protein